MSNRDRNGFAGFQEKRKIYDKAGTIAVETPGLNSLVTRFSNTHIGVFVLGQHIVQNDLRHNTEHKKNGNKCGYDFCMEMLFNRREL